MQGIRNGMTPINVNPPAGGFLWGDQRLGSFYVSFSSNRTSKTTNTTSRGASWFDRHKLRAAVRPRRIMEVPEVFEDELAGRLEMYGLDRCTGHAGLAFAKSGLLTMSSTFLTQKAPGKRAGAAFRRQVKQVPRLEYLEARFGFVSGSCRLYSQFMAPWLVPVRPKCKENE